MKKRLIITEAQLERLKQNITEGSAHSSVVKQMKNELDTNYSPIEKFVREGGEYYEKPMIMVKADEEAKAKEIKDKKDAEDKAAAAIKQADEDKKKELAKAAAEAAEAKRLADEAETLRKKALEDEIKSRQAKSDSER